MPAAPTPHGGHYLVNGERLPRVTTVLGVLAKPGLEAWKHKMGLAEANRISREAAELGTRVHWACEQVLLGNYPRLAHDDLGEDIEARIETPELLPFVTTFQGWLDQNVRDVLMVEQFLVHQRDGYAGTADLVARLKDGRVMLVDLKTSNSIDGTYRLQTAAYVDALHESGEECDGRLIVNLPSRQPGVLKTVEFDDYPRDLKAWRAVLRLFRWNERHKDDWRKH